MSSDYTLNGDWDVRGIDFETYLCGEITPKIIDADRIARSHVNNGFPNWALYRTVYAGDSHMRQMVRDWCVAFAISAAEAGLVRKGLPHEEMGALAGWDAYYRLHNARWVIAGQDIADVAGVDPKTYRKLRNYVYGANVASLNRYFVELQIAIRRVWQMDREVGLPASDPQTWRPVAEGEGGVFRATHTDGNGNYLAHHEG